jgi:choice-of-anchor B domain-containing protein
MRKRWSLISLLAVLVASLAGAPALAHHDDGSGKYEGVSVKQWTDFESVVSSSAPEGSKAPQSFAPCIEGMAAGMFPCDGVDMMSFIPHGALGTTFANDIWGWTDPQTGHEYAILGAGEGTVFVDITDAKRPEVLGILPTQTSNFFFWRDIKVYANHAFIVSEDNGHGMQVFDLTQLRDWDGTYTIYSNTAHYAGINSAHNLAINEDTGFAYAVGVRVSGTCNGGLHMIDINDPTNPTFAGCWEGDGYIHDTQCVIYEGPDGRYQGHEICFNSNAQTTAQGGLHRVTITDVTDKSNPIALGRMTYSNSGYSHQGWLTPDQQYFLHGDELDEVFHGIGTTTRVWDVRDLENPQHIGTFENETTSIDHNIYTKGRLAFASNYTSGLRVYDTRNVAAGELSELAYFDLYPENDNASFEGGTWSNYPYYGRNIVAVSSMDRGMFVLRVRSGLHHN